MSKRILCIGENWLGSDARAAFHAFRRLGHSVLIVDDWNYVPMTWRSFPARLARKLLKPLLVKEMARDCHRLIRRFQPDLVFVFKGNWVDPSVLRFCREQGIPTVNYYPDVSFLAHGPYIPECLPLYSHIFTTKSYGIQDMRQKLAVKESSFLEPGYDPELHFPVVLSERDKLIYECDLTFIGTWSPKKEKLLGEVQRALPQINARIWGCQWEKAGNRRLDPWIMGDEVTGDEYTKALCGASICLGLLSERREGASSGDLITARTFQIPACGRLMLHERNEEVLRYFNEAQEAAFFEGPDELVKKISYYLEDDEKREAVSLLGRERSLESGYSIDEKMRVVINWLEEREGRGRRK